MPLANVEAARPSGRLDAAKGQTYSPAALAEPIPGDQSPQTFNEIFLWK